MHTKRLLSQSAGPGAAGARNEDAESGPSARPSAFRRTFGSMAGVVAVAALALVASLPVSRTAFGSFDKLYFDIVGALFPCHGPIRVAVISLDHKTLSELGTERVFQRETYAELVDKLESAASITFDMLFAVRSPPGLTFAHAIARNGRVILPLPSDEVGANGKLLLPTSHDLASCAVGLGHHEMTIGPYGAVTGIVPYLMADKQAYPHVALEAIRVAAGATRENDPQRFVCALAPTEHPSTAPITLMLSEQPRIEKYSFVDVLKGRVPPSTFAGKLVFVGHSVFDEGEYRLSSLSAKRVPIAWLDAIITQALLDGDRVDKWPGWLISGIYVALALAMLAICRLMSGPRRYWWVLGWGGGVLLMSGALLAAFRIWVPVGALVTCGLVVYSVFAWRRLSKTMQFLGLELAELRRLSHAVVVRAPASSNAADTADALEHAASVEHDYVQTAMHQIRSWHASYVSTINLLPYPIFLERRGRIELSNDKAMNLLDAGARFRVGVEQADDETVPFSAAVVQQVAIEHREEAELGGVEIQLNGASHMLLVVTFAQDAEADSDSRLICLVDISGVKEIVTHDRQVLRHMAHDIRNPLTTILAMLEGERVKEMEGSDGRVEAFVDELRRLVNYSLDVAQDFLQLSRAEHLNAEDFAPVPLADLVYETVDHFIARAEQQSIALVGADLSGDEVFVLASRDLLMRALANLIDNAIKYSPPRSTIRVTVERDPQMAGRVALGVTDDGCGIPDEALPRLFEPFFQVDGNGSAARGVGLGLPFVKTVVERHGGVIEVESRVGNGSTFRMVLPIAEVELG